MDGWRMGNTGQPVVVVSWQMQPANPPPRLPVNSSCGPYAGAGCLLATVGPVAVSDNRLRWTGGPASLSILVSHRTSRVRPSTTVPTRAKDVEL